MFQGFVKGEAQGGGGGTMGSQNKLCHKLGDKCSLPRVLNMQLET